MPEVRLPRGYSGAGKSSDATEWVSADPEKRARVNRDSLRVMLFGVTGTGTWEQENAVTAAERAVARALLDKDISVVVDATNLHPPFARAWANLAAEQGADFQVVDIETSVEQCILRDKARGTAGGRTLGEETIRKMARKYPRDNWPVIEADSDRHFHIEPYVPDETLPPAWIVDVDGTVALKSPTRGIYDYTRVHEDIPNKHVIEVVRKLAADSEIIVLSGREQACHLETWDWLRDNGIPFIELHMRKTGDRRPDIRVKYELFNEHIRDRFHALGAIDDRLQVCRLWDRLGVPLLRAGRPDRDDF